MGFLEDLFFVVYVFFVCADCVVFVFLVCLGFCVVYKIMCGCECEFCFVGFLVMERTWM